jgi:carbamoyl-phosphate synthase large subunit
MKKILVTGANGDIGEAVGRILIDDFPNAEINGADCAGDLPGSFIFKEMIAAPPASDTKYERIVNEWIKTYDLIIPTTEPEIKKIASLFQDNDCNPFLVLPRNILNIFFDKYETYHYLTSQNLNPPMTKLLSESSEEDLPIYLKPKFGAGGKGNRVMSNKYDLLSAKLLPEEQWVVQELLTGKDNEYTCAIFKSDKFIETLQLKRELYGDRTGKAEVVNNMNIRKLLLRLAESLDFVGCLNVQLKLTDIGPKIFEINPRISSTVMMRNKIGFKDCLWWIKSKLKLPLDKPEEIKVGTKIFRMANEYVFTPE